MDGQTDSGQTNRQTDGQRVRGTNGVTDIRTDGQTHMWTNTQGKQADEPSGLTDCLQTNGQTNRRTNRQTDKRTDERTDGQTDIVCDTSFRFM